MADKFARDVNAGGQPLLLAGHASLPGTSHHPDAFAPFLFYAGEQLSE
ncbi:MAG: hypothetical protein E7B59_15360 [Enterobacteriaceae bacterium]|nr:hypothetical protein [Enterobacteriaceae bacterium]